jgi:hypothetical protein
MAEEQAAPAPTTAPEPADNTPLSVDDAVNLLNNSAAEDPLGAPERKRDGRGRFTKPEGEEGGDEEPRAAAQGSDHPEPSEEEPEPQADEAPEPSQEQDETEGDQEPEEQFADGNAKTRLRDGTVVPVADLKKAYDELQEVKRGGIPSEIRQEIDKVASDLKQRQEYLDKTLPLAVEALKASLPPEPPADLWDTDPIQATIDQRKHDMAMARLNSLSQAGQQQTQAQQQEQQQQFHAFIKEQQTRAEGPSEGRRLLREV